MRDPFVVVTSGRSGSLSLALALNQHPLLCVMHECYAGLIMEAYNRAMGRSEAGSLAHWFQMTIPRPAGPQVVGLVDQKLTFFVPDVFSAFPAALYIQLVRDGRDVVASGLARGWYSEGERRIPINAWAVYRIQGDEVGNVAETEWEELGAFGRNCWYWAYMQRTAREGLANLGERVLVVRLEDLAGDNGDEKLRAVQEFLGMQPLALGMIHTNLGPEEKVKRCRWRVWSEAQRATFERLCGAEMDRVYEGWREVDGWQRL